MGCFSCARANTTVSVSPRRSSTWVADNSSTSCPGAVARGSRRVRAQSEEGLSHVRYATLDLSGPYRSVFNKTVPNGDSGR